MFGLGVPELVVILVIGLLFFGPKKLPQFGKAVGETFKEVRAGLTATEEEKTVVVQKVEATPVKAIEKGKA